MNKVQGLELDAKQSASIKGFNLKQLKKDAPAAQARLDKKQQRLLDCRNIAYIASRAESLFIELGVPYPSRISLIMDIELAHEICPLDLDGLHNAEPIDFTHDIGGILQHFNRVTKKLDNGFAPRFALKQ